jgi:hypothetical protein
MPGLLDASAAGLFGQGDLPVGVQSQRLPPCRARHGGDAAVDPDREAAPRQSPQIRESRHARIVTASLTATEGFPSSVTAMLDVEEHHASVCRRMPQVKAWNLNLFVPIGGRRNFSMPWSGPSAEWPFGLLKLIWSAPSWIRTSGLSLRRA